MPLTQLRDGATSTGRSSAFVVPFLHRHTMRQIQELSAKNDSRKEQPERVEQDMEDDRDKSEIAQ